MENLKSKEEYKTTVTRPFITAEDEEIYLARAFPMLYLDIRKIVLFLEEINIVHEHIDFCFFLNGNLIQYLCTLNCRL